MDRCINILVTIALMEMMVAIGIRVPLADLVGVLRNGRLVAGAVLANYVCVPAITVGLLLLFAAQPMVAAGFLVLAVCPGAPFSPLFVSIAKGNVTVAVGLMVILAGSSAVVAPLLLHVLAPLLAGDEPLQLDVVRMVGTLLISQLLPLGVGLALRQGRPLLAQRLQGPADRVSKLLSLAAVGVILAAHFELLAEIRPRGYVGMLAVLLASGLAGWLLSPAGADTRKALTLTTSLRNVGVGLVIASGNFAGTPAVTAVVVYGLFEVVGCLVLAMAWGRHAGATNFDAPGRVSAGQIPGKHAGTFSEK